MKTLLLFSIPAFILFTGCDVRSCFRPAAGTFIIEPPAMIIADGDSQRINLEFYPDPAAFMRFHTQVSEQFSLGYWGHGGTLAKSGFGDRTSPIIRRMISQERPLRASVIVRRIDSDKGARLDFGALGHLDLERGETVDLWATFNPSYACLLDSEEGYVSSKFSITLE